MNHTRRAAKADEPPGFREAWARMYGQRPREFAGSRASYVEAYLAGVQCEREQATLCDLQQQLADEQRQHDITRGDLERTRLATRS